MDLNASGNPLGPQLQHAGDYYEGHLTGLNSPMQYACQPNFVIAITDGKSTGTDPRGEAEVLYTQDHSSTFPDKQNAIVHVIAFALPQADKDAGAIQELKEIAAKGGGSFFQADNAAELEKALQAAISKILAATFSFATPVVPTTGTSRQHTRLSGVISIQSVSSFLAWLYEGIQSRFEWFDSGGCERHPS